MKLFLVLVSCFIFVGCGSIYNNLSEKEKLNYKLEKINFEKFRFEPDTLVYSIDSKELFNLLKISKAKYKIVILISLTCPSNREWAKELLNRVTKIDNLQTFIIAQNDQIFKDRYTAFFPGPVFKKYMLNSEEYSFSYLDAIAQSDKARKKFIAEICPKCEINDGTSAFFLFNDSNNIVLYPFKDYESKLWKEGMNDKVFIKTVCDNIYLDIIKAMGHK